MLKKGADVNRANKYGATPLQAACLNGHVEVARLLLDKGAEVDRADEDGWTPLYAACLGGEVDAARLLLERGANGEIEIAVGGWWDPRAWARSRTPLEVAQGRARDGEPGFEKIVELIQAKRRQRILRDQEL